MTGSTSSPRGRIRPPARTAALLGLLVLVGFIVRVDALRNSAPPVPALGDARAYHLLGANLADGKGYIRPYEALAGEEIATAEYPPALPVLLAVANVAGVGGTEGQRVALCAVGALTVGLVGLLGRRLGGSDAAGYLAAALAAVHPGLWNADVSLMAEPVASFAGAALLLAAVAALDQPRLRRFALLGLLTGLGALVRSELLLIGLVLLVSVGALTARSDRRRAAAGGRPLGLDLRRRALRFGVGAAAALLVLAPWTLRNLAAFDGELVPLTNNAGSVARGANCDAAYRGPFTGLWVTDVALEGVPRDPARAGCFSGFPLAATADDDGTPNEARAADLLRREGATYVREHREELPRVVAARIGRTVGLHQLEQQSNFAFAEGRNATWDRRGTRGFQALVLVGVVGLALAAARGASRQRWLLLVPVACSLLVVAVTYGNPRFRAAAEPAVVVLGALGIVEVVEALAGRLRRVG